MNLGSCECVGDVWSKKAWGLKPAPLLVCGADTNKISPNSQLGFSDFACKRPNFPNLRIRREWDCFSHREVTPMEDGTPDVVKEETEITVAAATGFLKDFNSLPKPLSSTNIYTLSNDGAKVRVAYQGVPGAYSEDAALRAYPNCEPVPCDEYDAVFKAVELWIVDKAVLPIEDSVGGSIHRNYDSLLRHRLHIVGEIKMIVDHCLLGLPGVRKEEIKRVYSHPLTLVNCEFALNEMGVQRINASDSAGAAQMVALKGVREMGAIASARAAKIYGLNILEEGIQDDSDSVTRCLMLAREPIIPGTDRPYKTSIVFSLEEGPGVLFKALAVFEMRDINLSKIESRPLKMRPLRIVDDCNSGSAIYFDYLFYIDFEASMAEPRAQNALGHLQEFSAFVRVLGCYPMDTLV